MESFKEYVLNEKVTQAQLNAVEKYADRLFSVFNIDIEITKHFIDRVNDMRNHPEIDANELANLFAKTFKKHGKNISNMKIGIEAVINDLNSDINVPFVFKYDKRNKEFDVILKTIMRKKNFQTRTKKLHV